MPFAARILRNRRRRQSLRHPLVRLVVLALIALVLRWSSFGDPNLTADEGFYHTVGLAMHQGALPYVDLWARQPLGLFLIYWAISGISPAPLAYQLVACACAIATAYVIGSILQRRTGAQGALLAGVVYLVWLTPLFGFGGQSPVFYNLLMAAAALLVLRGMPGLARRRPSPGVPLAMLLAGLAITVKTTALLEAVFLGLCAFSAVWRSHRPVAAVVTQAAGWALLAAAPSLAIAGYYAAVSHGSEYWHAMVMANLVKDRSWALSLLQLEQLWRLLLPMTLAAASGLIAQEARQRDFVIGWLIAALAGLVAVPTFSPQDALPLLVVLCVAAGPLLDRSWLGLLALLLLTTLALRAEPPVRPGQAERSRAALADMAQAIRTHDGGRGLLVYAGPA